MKHGNDYSCTGYGRSPVESKLDSSLEKSWQDGFVYKLPEMGRKFLFSDYVVFRLELLVPFSSS